MAAEKRSGKPGRVCDEGENEKLNLDTSQKACLLSSGSEDRATEMNDYFRDKLRSLDESRLAEVDVMARRDVEDNLAAPVKLPDTSEGEPGRTVQKNVVGSCASQ